MISEHVCEELGMTQKNFLAILTASLLGFGATISSASADDYIHLKGLSVTSTVAEIESVFGPCGDSEENGWHYCGGSDTNAYKILEDGSIDEIYFHCELINACDYPVDALAQMIKAERSTIIFVNAKKWELGKIVILHGSAGDVLKLQSFEDDGRNAFISLSSNTALSLD